MTPNPEIAREPARPHGRVAKFLHWATAGLLLFAYIDNGDVSNALNDPAAMRMEAYLGKLKDGSRIFAGQPAKPSDFGEVVSLARPMCAKSSRSPSVRWA